MTFEKSLRKKPAKVVAQALAVVARIQAGASASEVGARRMRHGRHSLSVRLGRNWRLVFEEVDKQLVPIAVRSHGEYSRGPKPR